MTSFNQWKFQRTTLWLTVALSVLYSSQAWFIKHRSWRPIITAFSSRWQDDPVLQLPLMEAELATETNGEKRIKLEASIQDAKTSAEFGVRKVQFNFYEAFTNQDLKAMKEVWSTAADVRCVHPGMPSIDGIDLVMASWASIFGSGAAFKIQPSKTRISICGQTALCSCVEETPNGGMLECLNVYRREAGKWRMVLHMASPVVTVSRPPTSL